jgi:Ca2+-binding RTX toxin-like protein
MNGFERSCARRLAALAGRVAAVAVVAAATGVTAGLAYASSPHGSAKIKPKVKHGVLTVDGTKGDDRIVLRLVAGSPGKLQVDIGDGAADFTFNRRAVRSIVVDAGGGNNLVRIDESAGVFTDTIPTTIGGGAGDDTLIGGSGAERFLAGDGNDFVDGNGGNDVAFMGAGDDTFQWDPGDGSDTVEGEDGTDTMVFNGANAAEHVDLSANGPRLRFTRDVANITMDTDGVEQVDFKALGGADTVEVHDLTGTGVTDVNVDLGGNDAQADNVIFDGTADRDAVTVVDDGTGVTASGPDLPTISVLHPEATDRLTLDGRAAADRFTVDGTDGADSLALVGDGTGVVTTGLPATVAIANTEPGDQIDVEGLGGNDVIDGAAQASQSAELEIHGGAGDDTITGTQGVDLLVGGDGNDVLIGGAGDTIIQ